jgi:group I intron endonuclease
MKAKRICGIYCIENILDNKKYIGFSSNINRRWIEHNYSLKNKKDTRHLQNAWDIYGKENFIYYLLETCLPEHLEEKEV